ncbi:MAG: tRNA lysidine(34) synthetase TilS [Planctomycetota bacterium]|nr:tRNA lysidine(34) synthetase TilS [Planctomycetota bacterium]
MRAWRALSGGRRVDDRERRTLIACSGGADSSALAIALARASGELVLGHVVHDLREGKESRADADAVRALAARLGLVCDVREIAARRHGGNLEAAARRERYRALAEMARAHGCSFIAVAHHADDQLETMLMKLVRGAGPRGLGAMPARRRAFFADVAGPRAGCGGSEGGGGARSGEGGSGALWLLRPVLGVTRQQCEEICLAFGWRWQEDATNADTTRLRAAIRHRVLPTLREISPTASIRASEAAALLRQASRLVEMKARALLRESRCTGEEGSPPRAWSRERWRRAEAIVVGEAIRLLVREALKATRAIQGQDQAGGGAESLALDRMHRRDIVRAVRMIRGESTESKRFVFCGQTLRVTARDVRIEAG